MKHEIDIDGAKFSFYTENPGIYRNQLRKWLKTKPLEKRKQNLIPDLEKDLYHGWMRPALWELETMAWGRWAYWMEINLNGFLPERPIPEINFRRDEETFKHLDDVLDCIPIHGSWKSFGNSYKAMNYFLDWLLFAFGSGCQTTLPEEPAGCEGASMRLYQVFCLNQLIGYPYDYLGDLFVDVKVGDNLGFFPTPIEVCELMSRIVGREDELKDTRNRKVYDPCLGTGRTFLLQSNYCLAGYAQEINPLCIKAAKVNFFMYAPWYAAALPLEYLRISPTRLHKLLLSLIHGDDHVSPENPQSFLPPEEPKAAFADFLRKQYYSESNVLKPLEENTSLTFSVARHILRRD